MISCPRCQDCYDSSLKSCPGCGHEAPVVGGVTLWSIPSAEGGPGFREEYFDDLLTREAGSFWFRSRNRLIAWAVLKFAPGLSSFLDMGCGNGYVLMGLRESLAGARLAGSDGFQQGLANAARRMPGVAFHYVPAERLPFREEFDAIGAFDVLEHIEDDHAALAALHDALNPGGALFLTVPQHGFLWSASDAYACHYRRYERHELEAKVESAGFEVLRSTSFVSLLLPALLMTRKAGRAGGDPSAELSLPPLLDRLLEGVMALERAMIRSGISFPAGGSRLLVARKPDDFPAEQGRGP